MGNKSSEPIYTKHRHLRLKNNNVIFTGHYIHKSFGEPTLLDGKIIYKTLKNSYGIPSNLSHCKNVTFSGSFSSKNCPHTGVLEYWDNCYNFLKIQLKEGKMTQVSLKIKNQLTLNVQSAKDGFQGVYESKDVRIEGFWDCPYCYKVDSKGLLSYNHNALKKGLEKNGNMWCQWKKCSMLWGSIPWQGRTTFQVYKNSGYYSGDFQQGKADGTGSWTKQKHNSNETYEGEFKNNLFHGYGKLVKDDKVYEGQFLKGKFHGQGVLTDTDYKYEGRFQYDKKHGCGILTTRTYIYEGEFENNLKNGRGKCTDLTSKNVYRGEFRNDYKHGQGVTTDCDGNVLERGIYKFDIFFEHVHSVATNTTIEQATAPPLPPQEEGEEGCQP